MKKYRVVMLVIFMLMVSLLAFVSQGEDMILVNEVENANFEIEINKIKLETQLKEADRIAAERHEQVLLQQKIDASKFNEVEKLNQYFELKEQERALTQNARVDEIMKLTPLDEYTAGLVIEYADKYGVRAHAICLSVPH